jgi:hypothetical protein
VELLAEERGPGNQTPPLGGLSCALRRDGAIQDRADRLNVGVCKALDQFQARASDNLPK